MFIRAGVEFKSTEAIGSGLKRLQELFHRSAFASFGQHVQRKAIAFVQKGFHGAILGHGHRESRRREAGLTDPTRHHGTTELPLARREDAKGANHPSEGQNRWITAAFAHASGVTALSALFRLQQFAGETGADFLQLLHLGPIRTEFDPDRVEAETEAPIPQLRFQQVHSFTTPPKAAEHAHRLAAVSLREQGPQGGHHGGGSMTTQGWRADQDSIRRLDGGHEFVRGCELAVEAGDSDVGATHAPCQGIGNR
ncbi:MAG: Uncharacterised protein [Cyanobium sp. ARS6]|nr:MAG: Uncharacterised protein [Cyanobium sp. ARS6]